MTLLWQEPYNRIKVRILARGIRMEEQKKKQNKKALFISFLIIGTYMVVEVMGGILTNSLALLSDAGHMLSDTFSLGIALLAFMVSARLADAKRTYGNKRFEILAALLNGLLLIVMSAYIFLEATRRIRKPSEIRTGGMLAISILGLAVNITVALVMHKRGDVKGNLNMRGAFLHVMSDTLGSVGAIASALLVLFCGWTWADPVASMLVAFLILRSGIRLSKEAVHVLMEGSPKGINPEQVVTEILKEERIQSVHDFHLWTITSGFHALTCHAVVSEGFDFKEAGEVLRNVEDSLRDLGIRHATIQLEPESDGETDSLYCTS